MLVCQYVGLQSDEEAGEEAAKPARKRKAQVNKAEAEVAAKEAPEDDSGGTRKVDSALQSARVQRPAASQPNVCCWVNETFGVCGS